MRWRCLFFYVFGKVLFIWLSCQLENPNFSELASKFRIRVESTCYFSLLSNILWRNEFKQLFSREIELIRISGRNTIKNFLALFSCIFSSSRVGFFTLHSGNIALLLYSRGCAKPLRRDDIYLKSSSIYTCLWYLEGVYPYNKLQNILTILLIVLVKHVHVNIHASICYRSVFENLQNK